MTAAVAAALLRGRQQALEQLERRRSAVRGTGRRASAQEQPGERRRARTRAGTTARRRRRGPLARPVAGVGQAPVRDEHPRPDRRRSGACRARSRSTYSRSASSSSAIARVESPSACRIRARDDPRAVGVLRERRARSPELPAGLEVRLRPPSRSSALDTRCRRARRACRRRRGAAAGPAIARAAARRS